MTTAELLDRLIDAIASAASDKPQRLGQPYTVERDPAWKLHRAQARAACIDRDVCAMPGCLRATGLPLEQWCHRHAPDDVAIERYIDGEPMTLMRHERLEAIRRMYARGRTWPQIQSALHVSGATMRAALGERHDTKAAA